MRPWSVWYLLCDFRVILKWNKCKLKLHLHVVAWFLFCIFWLTLKIFLFEYTQMRRQAGWLMSCNNSEMEFTLSIIQKKWVFTRWKIALILGWIINILIFINSYFYFICRKIIWYTANEFTYYMYLIPVFLKKMFTSDDVEFYVPKMTIGFYVLG